MSYGRLGRQAPLATACAGGVRRRVGSGISLTGLVTFHPSWTWEVAAVGGRGA